MSDIIIDRGRGPEIKGTRVAVYRILDFVKDHSLPEYIAKELGLTAQEVQAALDYIKAHKDEVETVYQGILERVSQGNPEWIEAGRPKTPEELKRRILARQTPENAHADSTGQ
ncbi:MAG: DUF433 domain-containing protein [Gemmataceae bacterium]